MATRKRLLEHIDACNGEIRLQAIRYTGIHGDGWYSLVASSEQPDIVWERWDGLVAGDSDYFNAVKFFGDNGDMVTLSHGPTPESAMGNALEMVSKRLID